MLTFSTEQLPAGAIFCQLKIEFYTAQQWSSISPYQF
jgi:hypothetical protein